MSAYLVAMDGGQSTTLGVLADLEGRLLASGSAGPANHITEPGGPERFRSAATKVLEETCRGIDFDEVRLVFMAMSGGNANMRAEAEKLLPPERVAVVHDGEAAHAGALAGEAGVIVIGGSGSVGHGIGPDGRVVSIGGYGHILGDEGSAYWIAMEGLKAGFRALSGRAPATTILERIRRHLGVETPRAVHQLVYTGKLDRPGMASLATIVSEAEREGDAVAREIAVRAGHELGLHARAALRELGMSEGPVSWTGGVFQAGEVILRPFREEIAAEFPNARFVPPRYPTIVGSVLLGLRWLGIDPSFEILANIERTLPGIPGVK